MFCYNFNVDFYLHPRGGAEILKIFLYALLALVGLLVLVLLANVRLSLFFEESFRFQLSVLGIPIKPEWFLKKKSGGHKKKRKKAEKAKPEGAVAQTKQKKEGGDTVSLVIRLLRALALHFPKSFRIRIPRMSVTVGHPDAAVAAVEYGAIYAALSAALGVLEGYRGVFYGLRYKRKNIKINVDYTSTKTCVKGKITIGFFVWQLLFLAVRLGIAYILHILEKKERTE